MSGKKKIIPATSCPYLKGERIANAKELQNCSEQEGEEKNYDLTPERTCLHPTGRGGEGRRKGVGGESRWKKGGPKEKKYSYPNILAPRTNSGIFAESIIFFSFKASLCYDNFGITLGLRRRDKLF